jgi:hypothetical protein
MVVDGWFGAVAVVLRSCCDSPGPTRRSLLQQQLLRNWIRTNSRVSAAQHCNMYVQNYILLDCYDVSRIQQFSCCMWKLVDLELVDRFVPAIASCPCQARYVHAYHHYTARHSHLLAEWCVATGIYNVHIRRILVQHRPRQTFAWQWRTGA